MSKTDNRPHTPVLLQECLRGLSISPTTSTLVDCTFGAGGHSRAMLQASDTINVVALDRDKTVLPMANDLSKEFGGRLHFVNGVFGQIDELVKSAGFNVVDGILYDFGFSSMQVDDPSRGFSFQQSGPLSMQMGFNSISAHEVVNLYPEQKLADIFFYYGDERYARRVARAIVRTRLSAPIETTQQLSTVIASAIPAAARKGGIHPATKCFQAIRIEVNDELGQIKLSLAKAFEILKIGGRICTIAFHSLEDRIVKDFIRSTNKEPEELISRNDPRTWSFSGQESAVRLRRVAKVLPTQQEKDANPRARSAKLRVIEKVS